MLSVLLCLKLLFIDDFQSALVSCLELNCSKNNPECTSANLVFELKV